MVSGNDDKKHDTKPGDISNVLTGRFRNVLNDNNSDGNVYQMHRKYGAMYKLSNLDSKRAQLRLLIESRNDCVIKSVLPTLDEDVKQQFKHYINFKNDVLQSIHKYEQMMQQKEKEKQLLLSSSQLQHTTVTTTATTKSDTINVNKKVKEKERKQQKDMANVNGIDYSDDSKADISNDVTLTTTNGTLRIKTVTHGVMPFNFNQFLQYVELIT